MADMVDMKRPKPDPESGPEAMPAEANGAQYPYGLQIRLENEDLAKLGMKTLPQVGDEMYGSFMAEVTMVRQEDDGDGLERCISLQIKQLGTQVEQEQTGEQQTPAAERIERAPTAPVRPKARVMYGG